MFTSYYRWQVSLGSNGHQKEKNLIPKAEIWLRFSSKDWILSKLFEAILHLDIDNRIR